MAELDFDPGRLAGYLQVRFPDLCAAMTVLPIGGGQSNPTFRLRFAGRDLILRKQPAGELLPSAHAVDREFRVQKALAGSGVPVPEMVHLCEDRAVIGTLFYVMEALDGRVMADPALPGLAPAERAAVYDSMSQVLARLHQVDWRAIGLEGFGRPGSYFERQINRWTRQWYASKTREIPEVERLIAWLPLNLPTGDETRVVHGDYRMGNLMLHPREPRVIALLDWELSTLGHPLADLAYNCVVYYAAAEDYGGLLGVDLEASGIPSEQDYVARYCERTGRADGITPFHLAFSMFRFAVIFEGIAARARAGIAASADAEEVGKLSIVYARRACALIEA
jgi:aminoglycoside phosphotransferase (APT) family kinase protein